MIIKTANFNKFYLFIIKVFFILKKFVNFIKSNNYFLLSTMSKIFVKRFRSFLLHQMQKSKLYSEVGLIDVSVNYFNLFNNEVIGVSSCNITNDVYLREMEAFTFRGSSTIKKTSGYHMQDIYNENSKYFRDKIKYSEHVYRFIRTETTKNRSSFGYKNSNKVSMVLWILLWFLALGERNSHFQILF